VTEIAAPQEVSGLLDMGEGLRARAGSTTPIRVVADCETYIRGHHEWLVRTATAVGNAYRLDLVAHELLLGELYEVLYRRWGHDLLGVGEHARNGYAHRVLIYRAQRHRAARDAALGRIPSDGSDAEALRDALLDCLTGEERDVIVMMHGLRKDEAQTAAELGYPLHAISRIYESAASKLRAALRPRVHDEAGTSRGAGW
jgi:hypothetical protein